MAFIVVEMTGAIVFMLKLAIPPPAKGHEGGITTNPLLTTARFDQRHPLTSTEPTMLASNRFGFHPVIRQRLSSIRRDFESQVDVAACKRCDAGLQTAALLGPRSLRIRRDQGSQSLHMGQQSLQTACKQRTRPTGIANIALRDRLSKKKAIMYIIGEISSDLNEDLRG